MATRRNVISLSNDELDVLMDALELAIKDHEWNSRHCPLAADLLADLQDENTTE